MQRKTALVMCLCKLHNFIIDCNMPKEYSCDRPLDKDNFNIACNDGIPMEDGGIATVEDLGDIGALLHGGQHFDDFTPAKRKQLSRKEQARDPFLPRKKLLSIVEMKGLHCPTPHKKKGKKNSSSKKRKN